MFSNRIALSALSALFFVSSTTPAFVQADFPAKPIEVITHAGAGGDTDMAARMMMLQARRELRQEMQITNKRGGNGGAALKYLQSKVPDGHTLLTLTTSLDYS